MTLMVSKLDLDQYATSMRRVLKNVRNIATKAASTPINTINKPSLRPSAPELRNLQPFSPGAVTHVQFRRTSPASVGHLFFHAPSSGGPLDPSHPLTKEFFPLRKCPNYTSSLLRATAVPHALLQHVVPEQLPPFKPSEPFSPRGYTLKGPQVARIRYRMKQDNPRAVYASFLIVASKSGVHKDAVIRRKIARRIREAIKLIITRGARPNADGSGIAFKEQDIGEEEWLLPGHSYVVHTQLEAYRAPWPHLLGEIRDVLYNIKQRKRPNSWATRQPRPSDAPSTKSTQFPHSHGSHHSRKSPRESSSFPSPSRAKPPPGPGSRRSFSTGPSQSQSEAPRRDGQVSSAETDRLKPFPPETDYSPHQRRQMYRAESVLGQHDSTPVPVDLLPTELESTTSSHVLPSVVHPEQPDVVILGHDVDEIPAHWISEVDVSSDNTSISTEVEPSLDDLAEGYALYQPVDEDTLDTVDIDLVPLLDAATLLRLRSPHLPYHPGTGLEARFRRIQRSGTPNKKDFESRSEMKQKLQQKMTEAVTQRRKQRKVLRARWNMIDPTWLEELKWREERRLENLYQIRLSDVEKHGLDLRRSDTIKTPREGGIGSEDADIPWWKPRPADFEYNASGFEGENEEGARPDNGHMYRPLVPRPKWSERPTEKNE